MDGQHGAAGLYTALMAESELQTRLSGCSFQPRHPATPLFARLRSPQESVPSTSAGLLKLCLSYQASESVLLQGQGRDTSGVEQEPILGRLG